MLMRKMTLNLEWTILSVLFFGKMGLGALTFTTYPSQSGDEYICTGSTAILIWDYTTDETVTSINWYKEPGSVLIGNFVLGSFSASAAYTDRVSQYQTSTYKAAIQITNFASSDGGEYSCVVKTTTDYSQNGKIFYGNTPSGNVVIDYSDRRNSTCLPPNGSSGITITWTGTDSKTGTDGVYGVNTCKGGHVKCCMTGGSASCGNGSYCVEEDIPESHLLELLSLIFIFADVIFTIVLHVLIKMGHHDSCIGLLWILIISSPIIGIVITMVVTFVPCIESKEQGAGFGILIGVLFSVPQTVVKILFLCNCCKINSKVAEKQKVNVAEEQKMKLLLKQKHRKSGRIVLKSRKRDRKKRRLKMTWCSH